MYDRNVHVHVLVVLLDVACTGCQVTHVLLLEGIAYMFPGFLVPWNVLLARCPLLLWRCLWKPLARLSCPLPIWDMQEHHLLLLYWALEVYTSVNYWPVQNR